MELQFKPDVQETQKRWDAFWRGKSERPLLHAIVPKPGMNPVPMPRPYACAFGDLEMLSDQAVAWAASRDFLGDSIPYFMITLAPDHFAALLGAEIQPNQAGGSNWVEPCLSTLDDADIRFQREGRWWRRTVECVETFRAKCDGKLIITGTHLQGGLDCLSAMYGPENLLMDMAVAPDKVHRALEQVDAALLEVRKAMAEILDSAAWGTLNRFGMYSRGIIDVPQCDLSCMIGTEMFEAFQLPHLTREIGSTDASIYHLDGIGATKHLEMLCSIDALDMIQWMPGEGHYDDDWRALNAKIDALGKGQIFQPYYKLQTDDIRHLWETYHSRKLFFHVGGETCGELLRYYDDVSHAC